MRQISEDTIIRFINGTCTDDELIAVKEWIEESNENISRLLETERMSALASTLHDDTATRRRVRNKIQQRIDNAALISRHLSRRRIMRWTASIAASIAILFSIGYIALHQPPVKMIQAVASNESRRITLPDSSVVYLNVNSELRYPERFADEIREVKLSGEGYFEVKSDRKRPFIVNGQHLNVKVLGTQFNFVSRTGGTNSVSLKEGIVEVSSNNNEDGVALIPGQKASYDLSTGLLTVSETKAGVDAAWHDKTKPFEKANIADIRDILLQLYDVNIELEPGLDLSKTYSGVTVYYNDIDSTLDRLAHTLPITYRNNDNTITIGSRPDGNK